MLIKKKLEEAFGNCGTNTEYESQIEKENIFYSESYNLLENIAKALEKFGINVISYEGNSDYVFKLEQVVPINNGNSATDDELKAFASFIVEGCDVFSLLEAYEEDIFNNLQTMSDEQLKAHKEFYEYED